uniref:Uncharacterized protein n=1 Tax=Arundo donax TaxID=35708 RepID=A0A0A9AVM6_ARUDO
MLACGVATGSHDDGSGPSSSRPSPVPSPSSRSPSCR